MLIPTAPKVSRPMALSGPQTLSFAVLVVSHQAVELLVLHPAPPC